MRMNIKNNYTKCNTCCRCGECCASNLPLTRKEEKTIRKYIQEYNIKPEFFQDSKNVNLQCCFYDRKNKVCKIYEVRPHICRTFRCNKTIEQLEKEKEITHINAYWNKLKDNEVTNITDMRLLFYNDPRTLITLLIREVTKGTMNCTKEQFEFVKNYLKTHGQEELANCIKGEFE